MLHSVDGNTLSESWTSWLSYHRTIAPLLLSNANTLTHLHMPLPHTKLSSLDSLLSMRIVPETHVFRETLFDTPDLTLLLSGKPFRHRSYSCGLEGGLFKRAAWKTAVEAQTRSNKDIQQIVCFDCIRVPIVDSLFVSLYIDIARIQGGRIFPILTLRRLASDRSDDYSLQKPCHSKLAEALRWCDMQVLNTLIEHKLAPSNVVESATSSRQHASLPPTLSALFSSLDSESCQATRFEATLNAKRS